MNGVLNFFQDVITGSKNSKPVGLTSFKHETSKKVLVKSPMQQKDVKLSDLMRKPH